MKKSINTFLKHPIKDNANRSANPPVTRASTILFNTMQEMISHEKKIKLHKNVTHYSYGRYGSTTTIELENIIKKLDIKTEGLVGFEIYLDRLKDNKIKLKDLKSNFEYSDYQKSERDFAFVVDKNFKAQDLIEIISSIDKNLIRSIKIFDIYEGENIPQDKKSIALNVTIQSSEKTLEESDLEKINKLIISTVETKSGAKIRS